MLQIFIYAEPIILFFLNSIDIGNDSDIYGVSNASFYAAVTLMRLMLTKSPEYWEALRIL